MKAAGLGAEITFQAPDAYDHAWIDTETGMDGLQQGRVGAHRRAAIRDALVGDDAGAVLLPRHGEFRLLAVQLDDLLVRLDAGEGAIERGRGNAGFAGIGAHTGEKVLEIALGMRGPGGNGDGGGEQDAATDHRSPCHAGRFGGNQRRASHHGQTPGASW